MTKLNQYWQILTGHVNHYIFDVFKSVSLYNYAMNKLKLTDMLIENEYGYQCTVF